MVIFGGSMKLTTARRQVRALNITRLHVRGALAIPSTAAGGGCLPSVSFQSGWGLVIRFAQVLEKVVIVLKPIAVSRGLGA